MIDEQHGQIRQMQAEIRQPPAAATREARDAGDIWQQVWERPWLGFALSATVPGLVLSLIGPFGSYEAPLLTRFAYWMPTMALGACIGAALSIWSDREPLFTGRPAIRAVFLIATMTAAMTGVAWGMGQLVFGPGAITFGWLFVFYAWFITIVASAIASILHARRTTRVEVAAAPVPTEATADALPLTARLPEKLRGATILALQGEDHYVRVHTDKGSDLILIRLTDATAEMGETPGARTHRSWWESKGAVKSIRRDNGRVALVLTNDAEIPVSRGYASELREAGWLNR